MNLNIKKIFFCTGARNHSLLSYFEGQDLSFEIDERTASFKALGLCKISQNPVAICTTSGTAVAECLSALLEAYYSNLPLVLISGDRPKKLHGTGSPQTIDHEIITRGARKTFLEVLPHEMPKIDFSELEFPVHINVLVDDTSPHRQEILNHKKIQEFKSFLAHVKKPLFLFSHEALSMRPFTEKFQTTKLPFYAETLSGGRDLSVLKTEKKLCDLFEEKAFDSVIRVGQTPLSKIWRLLEKTPLPVFSFDQRNLSGLSYGEVLPLSSDQLLREGLFWEALEKLLPYSFEDDSPLLLEKLIQKFPESEISLFKKINESLLEDDIVYLGNSLVIRFFELTQKKKLLTFGNRGVNGIDGQLASAIGLSLGTESNVTAILGDITTFYDLASFKNFPSNLKLIVINNGGGQIFNMLKLDKRIVLEHRETFEKIAKAFNLSYSQDFKDFNKIQVLELFPDHIQSTSFLKEWME